MNKKIFLFFLGTVLSGSTYAECNHQNYIAGNCYDTDSGFELAVNKTITNLVLTKVTASDYQSRGYTEDDVGQYGTFKCSTAPKKWGNKVDGNVVEDETVYDHLTPDLFRGVINIVGGGTYHRILLDESCSEAAVCTSLSTSEAEIYSTENNGPFVTCEGSCDAATCCRPRKACESSLCTDILYTGALTDANAKCAGAACGSSDADSCCESCSNNTYANKEKKTCESGITSAKPKFKQVANAKNEVSNAKELYTRLVLIFNETGRSAFGADFDKKDHKDVRESLIVGSKLSYSRETTNGVEIKRKTFGRSKKTTREAAKNVPITVEIDEDGTVDVFEFDMVHHIDNVTGVDVPDYQAFEINIQGGGNITTVCQTTDADGGVICSVENPSRRRLDGRRLGIESCYRGGSVTYDSNDEVYTFDPTSIEFHWNCAVDQVGANFSISECVDHGTGYVQSYSRNTEWATYSAELECSLCPSGSGVESGTAGPTTKCEVCNAYTNWNGNLDNSPCGECPTGSEPTTELNNCQVSPGFYLKSNGTAASEGVLAAAGSIGEVPSGYFFTSTKKVTETLDYAKDDALKAVTANKCQEGSTSEPKSDKVDDCTVVSGYYLHVSGTVAEVPADWYFASTGKSVTSVSPDVPTQCIANSNTQNNTKSTQISDCKCEQGYYFAEDECKSCATGKSNSRRDPVGTNSTCSTCGPGEYAPSATQDCSQCVAGKYQGENPATSYACTDCPSSGYSAAGAVSCTTFSTCEKGYKVDTVGNATQARTCIVCDAGKSTTEQNLQTCTDIPQCDIEYMVKCNKAQLKTIKQEYLAHIMFPNNHSATCSTSDMEDCTVNQFAEIKKEYNNRNAALC